MDEDKILSMTEKVETGSMTDIPPDAPPGAWAATCKAEPAVTEEDHFRIKLSWVLDESYTSGNDDFAGTGKRVFDIPITFYPKGHPKKRSGWHERRFKALCAALSVDPPDQDGWTGPEFIALVKKLNGQKCVIYTRTEVDKESGEQRARVEFNPPKGQARIALESKALDEDDEDESAPPPKAAPASGVKLGPNGRPLKKKSK